MLGVLNQSDLIDIECDDDAAEATVQGWFGGEVPPTPTWTAKRGKHRLFKRPEGLPEKTAIHIDGVEVRIGNGKGACSVLPPSVHPDGPTYTWLPRLSLDDVEPAELPPEVVAQLAPPQSDASVGDDEDIPEGERNESLFSIGCRLKHAGLGAGSIEAALLAVNRKQCKPPLPEAEVKTTAKSAMSNRRELEAQMVCLADVTPEEVQWLWNQRIAIGKLSLIVGVPGLGKSLITTDIAARTSAGGQWPPIPPFIKANRQAPGGVVLMSCEDDLADTIQPRLVAAGADLKRINSLVGAEYKQPGKEAEEVSLDLKRHFRSDRTSRPIDARLPAPDLDPISGYLAGIDSHKDGEVRPILAKLAALAAKYRIAIVAVAHMNKSEAQAAIHRASGSTAFVAAARAVWGVIKTPTIRATAPAVPADQEQPRQRSERPGLFDQEAAQRSAAQSELVLGAGPDSG